MGAALAALGIAARLSSASFSIAGLIATLLVGAVLVLTGVALWRRGRNLLTTPSAPELWARCPEHGLVELLDNVDLTCPTCGAALEIDDLHDDDDDEEPVSAGAAVHASADTPPTGARADNER